MRKFAAVVVAVCSGVVFAGSVGGGVNQDGFQVNWDMHDDPDGSDNGGAWASAQVTSAVHRVESSYVYLYRDPSPTPASFVIQTNIGGRRNAAVNHSNMSQSLSYPGGYQQASGLFYNKWEYGGQVFEVAGAYANASFFPSIVFDYANVSYGEFSGGGKGVAVSPQFVDPIYWNWQFNFYGHFQDAAAGEVFLKRFPQTPEPTTVAMLGLGAIPFFPRRRHLA